MENERILYTIGYLPSQNINLFISNLKKYNVNCLVDIRESAFLDIMSFGRDKLIPILKANGINYLGFQDEFCFTGNDIMRRGKKVYEKIIVREKFVSGVERLKNGIDKGYTIAIFGSPEDPSDCDRTIYIARYLYENLGWTVLHILANGFVLNHKTLLETQEKKKLSRQRKNTKSLNLGVSGEEIAAEYLIEHGFSILDRNWNLHRGCELDIVAYKDNVLHVVEVKTRMYKEDEEVHPEFAVDYKKMKHIIKAIHAYKERNGFFNIVHQIDCIAIVAKNENDYTIGYYDNLRV